MIDIWKRIRNLPIRSRLLYGYLLIFLVVVCIANLITYLYLHKTINQYVDNSLRGNTLSIRVAIENEALSSLTNQLRVISERNQEIITAIYQQDLSEHEAKQAASRILVSQSLGDSGYLYVVNSLGDIQVHPDKTRLGQNISAQDFIHHKNQRKYGYREHENRLKDAGDSQIESLFMTYFGPWDWVITATIQKSEQKKFIDIKSLRKTILTKQIGNTGYPFVIDLEGNLIIHVKREGQNIYKELVAGKQNLFQQIQTSNSGKISLPWKDPGASEARELVIYYDYIPEFGWIVASACDKEELFAPLNTLRTITIVTLLLLTILAFALIWNVSFTITEPIKHLMKGFKAVTKGDLTIRLSPKSTDELGQLESYFNSFITQLEESNTRLNESEKSFRSIFENSVEGIFQFDMQGDLKKVNPSFVAMLGYSSDQALLEAEINFHRDIIVNKELWNSLIDTIIGEKSVKGFELQLYKKSGAVFWCLLNARGIHDITSGEIIRIEGFLSDIEEIKDAHARQEKILQDLETMVEERTVELSNRISELEEQDQQNRYMAEMADMLQSCRSVEETFPVIGQYLRKLFPDDRCALYLHDTSKQILDRVIPPIHESEPYSPLTNESCWALRRGKSYFFKNMDKELICDHVEESKTPQNYVCSVLIAHGVSIGLLHIIFTSFKYAEHQQNEILLDRKVRLCSRLAEHLSLALANLKLQEELKVKSTQDSLTGLANRRYMEEIMQRQFHRLLRYNTPFSVIMLDVDHFKKFNDTYGHDMGDHVLSELGNYLQENIRGEDLACRFGGEEFIIILIDTDIDKASHKAEKIREEIAQCIVIPHFSEMIHITVSIGVATTPVHGKNSTDLLKSVDNALYKAKSNGRNRVEIAQK